MSPRHGMMAYAGQVLLFTDAGRVGPALTPREARDLAASLLRVADTSGLPQWAQDALIDGTPIDRADGSALDLSETEVLAAWRAGVALRVRS